MSVAERIPLSMMKSREVKGAAHRGPHYPPDPCVPRNSYKNENQWT